MGKVGSTKDEFKCRFWKSEWEVWGLGFILRIQPRSSSHSDLQGSGWDAQRSKDRERHREEANNWGRREFQRENTKISKPAKRMRKMRTENLLELVISRPLETFHDSHCKSTYHMAPIYFKHLLLSLQCFWLDIPVSLYATVQFSVLTTFLFRIVPTKFPSERIQ